MQNIVSLREMRESDCTLISDSFRLQGWDKPVSQYEDYYESQKTGERDILIAELDGEFAGYLTIRWESTYIPFRKKSIPEIVDFNVLKKYQRSGIGTELMNMAEEKIKEKSDFAGIGFGLYKDYGAAQILYINRGYKPDGNGIIKNSTPVKLGETITIDDSIVFFLTKKL